MAKRELTAEEKEFRLDAFTLNNDFTYWLVKSKCMWTLREANEKYNKLRDEDFDHGSAFDTLKKKMFAEGIK
jgi:hypothetical protein